MNPPSSSSSSNNGGGPTSPSDFYLIGGHKVVFPYKPYPSQFVMMDRILKCISQSENALLESATGTGKSLALLCAALSWLQAEKQRLLEAEHIDINNNQNPSSNNVNTIHSQNPTQSSDRLPTKEESESVQSDNSSKIVQIKNESIQPKVEEEDDDDDDFEKPVRKKKPAKIIAQPQPKPTPTSLPVATRLAVTAQAISTLTTPPSSQNSPSFSTTTNVTNNKKIKAPKVFFASRTHQQVQQLISELKRSFYRPKMVVLASRDHYCLHPTVSKKPSSMKSVECKKMMSSRSGCRFDKNVAELIFDTDFDPGGIHEVWDIEDLVKAGQENTSCPYYAAKSMCKVADIIFCPYNYIIDPSIRKAMDIQLQGNIVIIDEGHNIEEALMSVASMDFDFLDLQNELLVQLSQLSAIPDVRDIHLPLHSIVQKLVNWFESSIDSLKPIDFENHTNVWTGSEMLQIFEEIGVNMENLPSLEALVNEALEFGRSGEKRTNSKMKEDDTPKLSTKGSSILEGLFKMFTFFFQEGLKFVNDFRLVIQKTSVHSRGFSGWSHTLGIWSLNPRVAFHSISVLTRSVILTSGTLAPIDSFQSELAAPFQIRAELGHVINVKTQVWAGVVTCSTSGQTLNSSFKTSDSFSFQDALGDTILLHVISIPSGVLCFFPSYSFLEKVITRWKSTGLWEKICAIKGIPYQEPKSGEDFPFVLQSYYDQVKSNVDRGALLLAVCRGKVSEGIDFTDHFARGVILVGIPYPNVRDLKVILKKEYNTKNAVSLSLMDGSSWYTLQAFRALNQAIGRCIRHKNDYGAIILIDERFADPHVPNRLSKWVRGTLKIHPNTRSSLQDLRDFFEMRKQLEPVKS